MIPFCRRLVAGLAGLVLPVLAARAQPVDDPTGLARQRATAAARLLDRALAAHVPVPAPTLELVYAGAWRVEGHFRRPHEIRSFPTRERYVVGPDRVRFDSVTGESEKDLGGSPETFLAIGERVLRRAEVGRPFLELGPGEREGALFWATAALPAEIVRRARQRLTSARLDGDAIAFTDSDGVASTLSFDRATGLLRSVERLRADPRLGDVCDWIAFDDYAPVHGIPVPRRVRLRRHPLDEAGWLETRLESSAVSSDSRELELPAEVAPAPRALVASPALRIEPVADGVWAVVLEDLDSRVLAVELPDGLAVLEAPVGSAAGERIVDALKERFPERPIRLLLMGHYHPHYTGGLRAFVAAGATVVTTKGNEAFVREMAARPFTFAPDRLARSPKPLRLETVSGARSFGSGRIEAIDIGPASRHTDEYLVFHLPAGKLLFQGDLGWFTPEGGELRAGSRAAGLLATIDERHLDVTRLVQSWPAKGSPGIVTLAELRELVRKREEATKKK